MSFFSLFSNELFDLEVQHLLIKPMSLYKVTRLFVLELYHLINIFSIDLIILLMLALFSLLFLNTKFCFVWFCFVLEFLLNVWIRVD